MKKTIKVLSLLAAVAMTLIGCSKSDEVNVKEKFTHRVTIKASSPATKTVIVEGGSSASFKWSSDDASRFTITENGVEGKDIVLTSTDSYATMSLSATFEAEAASTYVYNAFLAKNKTTGGAPKIPAAQTSTATSYDPNADILIAEPQSFSSVQSELEMKFARPVVINKMTLKGLDKNEIISSITVSADKNIIGYYTIANGTWSGQASEITISTEQTVPASGEVTVFFVTMPVSDVTLNVSVTTGNYIYTKQFTKTINFVVNQVTKFGVSSFTRNNKLNYNGTYVLANTTGTAMAGVWDNGNSIPEVSSYVESDVLYYDPDVVNIGNAKVTLAKNTNTESEYYGMYTIKQNGLYLYAAASDKNQLKGESEPDVNAYWEVSEDSGVWSIVASKSSNRNILKYNSGNKIFSCYSSGQEDVKLFTTWAPTPVITADNIAISSAAVTITNTGATFNSNTATVTALAYDNSDLTTASTWLTVSVSGTTVNYAASANTGDERTGYIKITATNSDSHSVEKVISVTQEKPGSTSKVDILTQSWTGVSGTNYSAVSDLAGSASDAVYSVQCAGGNSSIQLRSNNNNSGIVTTTSGGKVKKITVTWGSGNNNGRTLDIYGKSSAYSAPSDLYNNSTQGTKLGSIVYGTSTVFEITGDYEYVGLRSNNGAMYLSEIKIEWEASGSGGGNVATLTLSSSLKFATSSGSTLTDDNNNVWTVTTTSGSINGAYNSSYNGEQFGTSSAPWSGTFSSPIPGTITKVVVNANTGGSATLSVTVGSTEFTCSGESSISVAKNTSSANSYEFTGSATGNVVISLSGSSKACYFGGVVVTYLN